MSVAQLTNPAQSGWPVVVNENFEAIEHQSVYGMAYQTTVEATLTWGYYGGRWGGNSIAAGTLALENNETNHIVVRRTTGAISVASSSDSNWNDTENYARVYSVKVVSGAFNTIEDHRAGPYGVHGQTAATPSTYAATTTESGSSRNIALADAGKYLRFTGSGAKSAFFDSSLGYTIDSEFHIANRGASGDLTLYGDSNLTLNAPKGGLNVLEPGDTVTVKIVAADKADVFGSTKDAP